MKKFILDNCMNIIKEHKNYDEIKLAEIKYGLEGLYLTISKIIILSILSLILGIFKEFILFLGIFTIMRIPSFGIHASKSWICLVSSTLSFIGIPLIALNINLSTTTKIIIGAISILGICLFSPADTHKRPIINKTRRKIYKLLSTVVAFTYIILSLKIQNDYLSNCFFYATILQNILISPITYKLSKMPYNNYKAYIAKYGLNY